VSDRLHRQHGLETFLQTLQQTGSKETGIDACIPDDLAQINLRGDTTNADFKNRVETALGQPLPVIPNTLTNGEHRVYWLGPDEWLVVSTATDGPGLAGHLSDSLANVHASVNDVSGGQVTIRLIGKDVRSILSRGCSIDFHEDSFKPGDCAQSGLAKASVVIGCIDQSGTIEVIVRRSFADYLARWLQNAARDVGIEFH
jgi:sarcosine oxidase subunit gamma